jgi:hypothetical protein
VRLPTIQQVVAVVVVVVYMKELPTAASQVQDRKLGPLIDT